MEEQRLLNRYSIAEQFGFMTVRKEPICLYYLSQGIIMLIIFRSKAAANVMMLKDLTVYLFDILGRELQPNGIFTVEQLPLAIQKLEGAIANEVKPREPMTVNEEDKPEPLRLAQRAFPLLDMLRRAAKKHQPVVWQILSTESSNTLLS